MSFGFNFDFSHLIMAPILDQGSWSDAPEGPTNTNIMVQVFPQWLKAITLTWSIPAEWGACKFHVYTKPGPSFEYERLTSMALTQPYFQDTQSLDTSKYRHSYYCVEVILPNGSRLTSVPASWSYVQRDKNSIMASEIQRREFLLLSKFAGVATYYFKRMYYGERCPRCWNDAIRQVTDDHCPVCIGTSFKGGYYSPIPVFLQYTTAPSVRTLKYFGKSEPSESSAWTISLPEMEVDDILIRQGDWGVYRIINIQNTELQTNTVRQMLSLTQLNTTDVENLLIQRTTLDDFGNYLDTLGGAYSLERFPRTIIDSSTSDNYPWSKANQNDDLAVLYPLPLPAPIPIIPKLSVSGSQILDATGKPIILKGYNWCSWGSITEQDALDNKRDGANLVRIPVRWWSPPTAIAGEVDCRLDSAPGHINPTYLAYIDSMVQWASDNQMYIDFFISSGCGQDGTQPGNPAYCDPNGIYPQGHNFWTDHTQTALYTEVWKFIVNRYKDVPYMGMYELLVEPNPRNITLGNIRKFYTNLIDELTKIDNKTPFLVGPNNSYEITLSAQAYLPGYNNVIYTADLFYNTGSDDPEVNYNEVVARLSHLTAMRSMYNVPIYIQQVGVKPGTDPDQSIQVGFLKLLDANQVGSAWWEYRGGPSSYDYGIYYQDVNNPGQYIEHTAVRQVMSQYFNNQLQTLYP